MRLSGFAIVTSYAQYTSNVSGVQDIKHTMYINSYNRRQYSNSIYVHILSVVLVCYKIFIFYYSTPVQWGGAECYKALHIEFCVRHFGFVAGEFVAFLLSHKPIPPPLSVPHSGEFVLLLGTSGVVWNALCQCNNGTASIPCMIDGHRFRFRRLLSRWYFDLFFAIEYNAGCYLNLISWAFDKCLMKLMLLWNVV